uniref:Uncharacterized protein n=1 Tax=Lygus hesperus TaxID=30085 RepID=A0A146L2G5_LYGHE
MSSIVKQVIYAQDDTVEDTNKDSVISQNLLDLVSNTLQPSDIRKRYLQLFLNYQQTQQQHQQQQQQQQARVFVYEPDISQCTNSNTTNERQYYQQCTGMQEQNRVGYSGRVRGEDTPSHPSTPTATTTIPAHINIYKYPKPLSIISQDYSLSNDISYSNESYASVSTKTSISTNPFPPSNVLTYTPQMHRKRLFRANIIQNTITKE